MNGRSVRQKVSCVQYDTGVVLLVEFDTLELSSSSMTATVFIEKPSGKVVYQNATISGNAVRIKLNSQGLAEEGIAVAQAQVKQGTDIITSFAFDIDVQRSLSNSSAEESRNIIDAIDEKIDQRMSQIKGFVKSVNGSAPDTNGNVSISIANPADVEQAVNDYLEIHPVSSNDYVARNLANSKVGFIERNGSTIEFYTDAEKTTKVADIQMTNGVNRNLIDNGWFTVNQRGESEYSSRRYGFDRWYVYDKTLTGLNKVSILNNVITTYNLTEVRQMLDDDAMRNIIGKTVTLSVLLSDDTIEYKTFTIGTSASWTESLSVSPVRMVRYNGKFYICAGYLSSQKTFSFKALKLEIGDGSTLHLDCAPNYADELLRCQRYFVRYSSINCIGINSNYSNEISVVTYVPIPIAMAGGNTAANYKANLGKAWFTKCSGGYSPYTDGFENPLVNPALTIQSATQREIALKYLPSTSKDSGRQAIFTSISGNLDISCEPSWTGTFS